MLKILNTNCELSKTSLESARDAAVRLKTKQDLGFLQLHYRDMMWEDAYNYGIEIAKNYTDLVIIGIGGSSLGPKVLRDVFQTPKSEKNLHILDNVDPVFFARFIEQFGDLSRVAWVIISKSGSTLETLALAEFVSAIYEKLNLSFHRQSYIVSEPRLNPLTEWAKKHDRPVLELPVDVGGRYSIFTSVGLLPLAFLGVNLLDIKKGIQKALENSELTALLTAHYLDSFKRQEWITVLFSYSSLFQSLGEWWQQLWAESLAKKNDRIGQVAPRVSTPLCATGACDQHSVLQQFMHGHQDKFFTFLRVKEIENQNDFLMNLQFNFEPNLKNKSLGQILAAEAQATQQALTEVGAANLCLQIDDLSPASISELLTTWLLVVGTLGEALNINAFDQPGVEAGKKIAREILSR